MLYHSILVFKYNLDFDKGLVINFRKWIALVLDVQFGKFVDRLLTQKLTVEACQTTFITQAL
jgi:hypothetical protein